MVKQNLPELRIWSWEFKDDKAAKVCMAEYQRGEVYQKKNSGGMQRVPLKCSVNYLLVHASEKITCI